MYLIIVSVLSNMSPDIISISYIPFYLRLIHCSLKVISIIWMVSRVDRLLKNCTHANFEIKKN